MAKVKIKLEPLRKLIAEMPLKVAVDSNREIAKTVKEKILSFVERGISPIEGMGRFPSYKPNDGNKKKYPDTVRGDFPGKRRRPVNLSLSGKFLRSLKSYVKSRNIIEVGFTDDRSKILEAGHRFGANGQGKRPIIPLAQNGEDFVKSIKLAITKIYRDNVIQYLKKSK